VWNQLWSIGLFGGVVGVVGHTNIIGFCFWMYFDVALLSNCFFQLAVMWMDVNQDSKD
jgi:hypothetical protein